LQQNSFGNRRTVSSYKLNNRGQSVCQLINTIIEINTIDQLHQLLRNLKSPSSQWYTDDVRSELVEIAAKLQAQEALLKALFALCPKRNPGAGFEPTLTEFENSKE
jgi:hypothetical protein